MKLLYEGIVSLKKIEYGFGYVVIRFPYNTQCSTYLRATVVQELAPRCDL